MFTEGDDAAEQAAGLRELVQLTAAGGMGTRHGPIKASVANDPAAWVKNARPLLALFVETMSVAHARLSVELPPADLRHAFRQIHQ